MKKRKKMITIKSLDEIPRRFKSEDAERKFWETHDLSLKLCEKLYDPVVDREEKRLMKHLKMTDRRR
ncbi:MAG: hypothetical protein A3B68_04635 [Candidatus Melainabacteria bacterium RIFCSPHIGHO2_02_FULL_34_12]|nr:MAG: hypothetical protein A3B68_04635 [Candidatus Melainabacteria bacterium RIFCSPHIGHO2_02_FULL_34_12]